ncbi:hypothetical protein SDC9_178524 [bioreactor metagenome]|uniref:Uncharacterized protein n=1 Tax=bioreactor metagenome TaxID=1076179 RepID=A0A645GVZ3_9ZZZZ
MDQNSSHSRVDTPAQAAEHLLVTNLGFDLLNSGGNERTHIPVLLCLADTQHEVLQELLALGGMHHLRMELYAVEALLIMLQNRIGAVGSAAGLHEPRREG